MGFDAGSITAYLKLDRTEFDEALAQVQGDAEKLEDDPIEIKATLNAEEFDEGAADVEATKEALSEDGIDVPAKIDTAELAASAAEAEAIVEGLRETTGTQDDGMLSLGTSNLRDEAAEVQDILASIEPVRPILGTQVPSIAEQLAAQGISREELLSGGLSIGGVSANDLVDVLMPSPEAIGAAMRERLTEGIYAFTSAPADPLSSLYSVMGGERTLAGGPFTALGSDGEQLALGTGSEALLPPGVLVPFIDSTARLAGAADGAAVDIDDAGSAARATQSALRTAALALSGGGGGGGGGGIGGIFSRLWKSASGFSDDLDDAIDKIPLLKGGLPGLTAAVPLAGALGLAAGGAVAGTSIGLAGTAWALVPGLLDLYKGYEAYSAESSGQSTSGMSAGSLSIANALKPLVSGVSGSGGFLGGLETTVNPQIVSFLNTLTKALPAIAPFADKAVSSMSRFFDTIDKGLSSGGFKSFMSEMSSDVGPIMDEFGRTITNLGGAFGGFLRLFGGGPAQMVGTWFDTETKKLETFLARARITPDFMAGAKTVFDGLASALDLVWNAGKKVAEGLAPIGLTIFKIVTPAFQGLSSLVNGFPTGAITAIGVGLLGLAIAASPLLQVAAALTAVGLAIHYIQDAMKAGQPLTFGQLTDATKAYLTPVAKQTPAEIAALAQAKSLGYTPQSALTQYLAEKPSTPTAGGVGFHSLANTAPTSSATPGQRTALSALQQTPKAPPITGWTRWGKAVGEAFQDIGGALEAFQRAMGRASSTFGGWVGDVHRWIGSAQSDIHDFYYNSIPNALDHFENFWTRAWGDAEGAGVKAYQTIDNNVIHPVAHFFTNDIPQALDQFESFWKRAWSDVESDGVHAWQLLDSEVIQPVVRFFTVDIPGALDAAEGFFTRMWSDVEHDGSTFLHWISGLPGDIKSALGSGLNVLVGWGRDLIQGIVNGIKGAAGLVESALKSVLSKIPGASLLAKIPGIGGLFKAAGGPVYSGSTYIVGERGPEVFSPTSNGYITPNNQLHLSPTSGGATITIMVDARGASDVAATRSAVQGGINSMLPQLRAALERGTGSLAGVA